MGNERMTFHTKPDLDLPKRKSPLRFAVLYPNGFTSNTWGVRVKRSGDAYIYCRDHMKGQKVSLHSTGKQHISLDDKSPNIGPINGSRFMNQWAEPKHGKQAVPTFRLVFPPWGIRLRAEQREEAQSEWKDNDVLIEGDDRLLTVVSFVILDNRVTLRKEDGSSPSYPIGVLPLRPGKKLIVIAGKEPEGDFKEKIEEGLKKIDVSNIVPERLFGDTISMCMTGNNSVGSVFMVAFPAVYLPTQTITGDSSQI